MLSFIFLRKRWAILALLMMISQPAIPQEDLDLTVKLAELGATPCELNSLVCIDLSVPIDHQDVSRNENLEVSFAFATSVNESQGLIVFFPGGPGSRGTLYAEAIIQSFPSGIVENFDIMFFDPRGVDADHGIECPNAIDTDFFIEEHNDPISLLIAQDKAFVAACQREMLNAPLLPFIATVQTINDIEAMRQAIGAPPIWIIAESYGTLAAQHYAATFPEAIAGVILDGVIDPKLDLEKSIASNAYAADLALLQVLDACDALETCAQDMGRSAHDAFYNFTERLRFAQIPVQFPAADGSFTERELTLEMFSNTAFSMLYAPWSRAYFLRALAEADQGELTPMLRLFYSDSGSDPNTLKTLPDFSWNGTAIHVIPCYDYPHTYLFPAQEARARIERTRSLASESERLLSINYAPLSTCAFWPELIPPQLVPTFKGGVFPTIILSSPLDPVTPINEALAVLDRLENGFHIILENGPHGVLSSENECVADLITALLLHDQTPANLESICTTSIIEDYRPLHARRDNAFKDPAIFSEAVLHELETYRFDLSLDADAPQQLGCNAGGYIRFWYDKFSIRYEFHDCALWPEIIITGEASHRIDDYLVDGLSFQLAVTGKENGEINFFNSTEEGLSRMFGTWRGQEVEVSFKFSE